MRVEFKAVAAFLIAAAGCVLWLSQEESLQSHVKEFVMERQNTKQQMTDDRSQMVTLKRSDGEVKIDLEEYLKGVVGSEMTPSFEMEALKAQAVAARTFAASRDYCVDDSTSSQVYLDDSQLKAAWKGNYDANKERIEEAVDATRGEIMVYEGEPITAFFFASAPYITAGKKPAALPFTRHMSAVYTGWSLKSTRVNGSSPVTPIIKVITPKENPSKKPASFPSTIPPNTMGISTKLNDTVPILRLPPHSCNTITSAKSIAKRAT